jgi:hypothetical protein
LPGAPTLIDLDKPLHGIPGDGLADHLDGKVLEPPETNARLPDIESPSSDSSWRSFISRGGVYLGAGRF